MKPADSPSSPFERSTETPSRRGDAKLGMGLLALLLLMLGLFLYHRFEPAPEQWIAADDSGLKPWVLGQNPTPQEEGAADPFAPPQQVESPAQSQAQTQDAPADWAPVTNRRPAPYRSAKPTHPLENETDFPRQSGDPFAGVPPQEKPTSVPRTLFESPETREAAPIPTPAPLQSAESDPFGLPASTEPTPTPALEAPEELATETTPIPATFVPLQAEEMKAAEPLPSPAVTPEIQPVAGEGSGSQASFPEPDPFAIGEPEPTPAKDLAIPEPGAGLPPVEPIGEPTPFPATEPAPPQELNLDVPNGFPSDSPASKPAAIDKPKPPAPRPTPQPNQRANPPASEPYSPAPTSVPTESDDSAEEEFNEEIYQVQNGDNYWTISRRFYGTARFFGALAEYNKHRISDPAKMKPGMYVLIPDVEVLHTRYPELTGGNQKTLSPDEMIEGFFVDTDGQPMYRVGKGVTLTDIAQAHLGRATRWVDIYRLNQEVIPNVKTLKIGSVLRLPSDASQIRVIPGD